MKSAFSIPLVIVSLLLTAGPGVSQEQRDAEAQLKELVGKVQTKLRAGQNTENALAAELAEFDALLDEHQGNTSDAVAQILFMKAMLYEQVFDNADKAATLTEQLVREFPDTPIAAMVQKQLAAKKVRSQLAVGATFPDFKEEDLDGKPLSVAQFRGKAVLIDFWATWCGPCIVELPHVQEAYRKYHSQGFEIIGISLDRSEAALKQFIQKHNMTWPQFFDGKGWENKLAGHYGINSIPATYLLDGEGRIVATNLRGKRLEEEVAKLVAKP